MQIGNEQGNPPWVLNARSSFPQIYFTNVFFSGALRGYTWVPSVVGRCAPTTRSLPPGFLVCGRGDVVLMANCGGPGGDWVDIYLHHVERQNLHQSCLVHADEDSSSSMRRLGRLMN